MTSIFEGQPPKTKPFPIKTRVIWVLGIGCYFLNGTMRPIVPSKLRDVKGPYFDKKQKQANWRNDLKNFHFPKDPFACPDRMWDFPEPIL